MKSRWNLTIAYIRFGYILRLYSNLIRWYRATETSPPQLNILRHVLFRIFPIGSRHYSVQSAQIIKPSNLRDFYIWHCIHISLVIISNNHKMHTNSSQKYWIRKNNKIWYNHRKMKLFKTTSLQLAQCRCVKNRVKRWKNLFLVEE